jgi:hypothetical protein
VSSCRPLCQVVGFVPSCRPCVRLSVSCQVVGFMLSCMPSCRVVGFVPSCRLRVKL